MTENVAEEKLYAVCFTKDELKVLASMVDYFYLQASSFADYPQGTVFSIVNKMSSIIETAGKDNIG